jgi:Ca-activated chloride channel family protein
LLTDVDIPTGIIPPETAAELAREAGLPLYTIAIGANSSGADEEREAGLIYAPVDLALVKSISERTGVRHYQAGDASALEQAIEDIARHETNKRLLAPRYYHETLYFWPLLAGLALLIVSLFLSTRLSRQRTKQTSRNPRSVTEVSVGDVSQ